jgi:hypothetical protein
MHQHHLRVNGKCVQTVNPYWESMKYITIPFLGANRDTLIITNTLKAIVPVIAVLLSAVVPQETNIQTILLRPQPTIILLA